MISKAQRVYFMADLWPRACAAQGWKKSDNAKRYALFASVLGTRPRHARTLAAGRHISLNDFDQADFDAIKAHLQMLTGNLRGTIETEHPEHGQRRRLEWKANDYIQKLGAAYASAILRDRFGASDLSQLTDRDLKQLLATLAARLSAKKKTLRPSAASCSKSESEPAVDPELTPF